MEKGKLKGNKGITLIALIITIIIMLILAGVTINVALNGGLFDTANTAVKDTERDIIYDQIIGAMEVKNNGNFNVKETYDSAKTILVAQGKTVEAVEPTSVTESTAIVNFTVTGKKGTYEYSITETEIKKGYTQIPEETMLDKLQVLVGETLMEDGNILLLDITTLDTEERFFKFINKYEELNSINVYAFKDTDLALLVDTSDNNKEYYLKFTAEETPIVTEVGIYPTPIIKDSGDLIILTNYKEYDGLSEFDEGNAQSFLIPGEFDGATDRIYHDPGRLPANANAIMVNSNETWEIPTGLRDLEYVLIPNNFEGTITKNGIRFVDTSTLSVLEGVPTVTIEDVTYYKVPWTGK